MCCRFTSTSAAILPIEKVISFHICLHPIVITHPLHLVLFSFFVGSECIKSIRMIDTFTERRMIEMQLISSTLFRRQRFFNRSFSHKCFVVDAPVCRERERCHCHRVSAVCPVRSSFISPSHHSLLMNMSSRVVIIIIAILRLFSSHSHSIENQNQRTTASRNQQSGAVPLPSSFK